MVFHYFAYWCHEEKINTNKVTVYFQSIFGLIWTTSSDADMRSHPQQCQCDIIKISHEWSNGDVDAPRTIDHHLCCRAPSDGHSHNNMLTI